MRDWCQKENPDCKYFSTGVGCFSDTHHEWWPKSDYNSYAEKTFRDLAENKEQLCRQEHDDLHAEEDPPPKPPIDFMWAAIHRARGIDVES